MNVRTIALLISFGALLPRSPSAFAQDASTAGPLIIGETFTIDSKQLHETRRINVYAARSNGMPSNTPLPVLYMPDGGINEDFLHVAGLLQAGAGNGSMRPVLLVGIENTERRRDMTGLTEVEGDRRIAPHAGGSTAFRAFIREELIPKIRKRYATTDERAIVGESLAGLFVIETFLLEPDLFDTYIAFDPSLWWNHHRLLDEADARLKAQPKLPLNLYFVSSDEKTIADLTQQLADTLGKDAPPSLQWHYEKMPEEHHSAIYQPAALKAFRSVFAPLPPK